MNNGQAGEGEKAYALEILLAKTQIMMFLRFGIVALLLGCILIFRYAFGIHYPISFFLVIALIAVSYTTFFFILEKVIKFPSVFWPQLFVTLRVALDIILMTIVLYHSGGVFSPLVFFFILSIFGYILSAGNLVSSLLMSFWAVIVYSSIFALPHYNFFPPAPIVIPINDSRYLITRVSLLAIAVFVVSIMVNLVVQLLGSRENEAALSKKQLEETRSKISDKMEEMQRMDHFMEGREADLSALKNEANRLLAELGRPGEH